MPELPEVETVVRSLAPRVAGKIISDVEVLRAKTLEAGAPLLDALKGARVIAVRRRAKLALLDVLTFRGGALSVAFHLKMTGRLFICPPSAEPSAHTRIVFALEEGKRAGRSRSASRLFFDDARCFGYCRVMRPEDFEEWTFWNSLGPEPLVCPPKRFAARARERRGNIKALLLDQSFIAGIGNIYADESLFRAGVDPRRSAADIDPERMAGLFRRIREVLREAVAACGSSIRDYLDAEGRAGAFQNAFRVYGRGGKPCLACGKRLERIRVAGRGTVYCPNCQK